VERLLYGEDGMDVTTGTQTQTASVQVNLTPAHVSTGTSTDATSGASTGSAASAPASAPVVRPRSSSTASSSSSYASCSSNSGGLPRAYANVRAARSIASTVRPLYGSEVHITNDLGTFLNHDDNRYTLANHRHCYTSKKKYQHLFYTGHIGLHIMHYHG
jgi:hypothetical protein